MKIFIICSKQFYPEVKDVKEQLEKQGNEVFLPNCYDEPDTELKMKKIGVKEHQEFKARMYKQSEDVIKQSDAVLVLNYDKEKDGKVYKNYIGGATFLEMYDAFRLGKEIYMMNDIPEGMLYDEIDGFSPVIIHGDVSLLQEAFGCSYAEFCKEVVPNITKPTPVEYPETYQFMSKKDKKKLLLEKGKDTE